MGIITKAPKTLKTSKSKESKKLKYTAPKIAVEVSDNINRLMMRYIQIGNELKDLEALVDKLGDFILKLEAKEDNNNPTKITPQEKKDLERARKEMKERVARIIELKDESKQILDEMEKEQRRLLHPNEADSE